MGVEEREGAKGQGTGREGGVGDRHPPPPHHIKQTNHTMQTQTPHTTTTRRCTSYNARVRFFPYARPACVSVFCLLRTLRSGFCSFTSARLALEKSMKADMARLGAFGSCPNTDSLAFRGGK